MNLFVVGLGALALLVCVLADEKYTTRWDNVNVEEILHNERLLERYINCLTGIGKCNNEGSELRKVVPEAIATDCAKCSEKQKEFTKRVLYFLIQEKPKYWNQLKGTYDADGEYEKKFKEKMEAEKALEASKA